MTEPSEVGAALLVAKLESEHRSAVIDSLKQVAFGFVVGVVSSTFVMAVVMIATR